MGNPMTMSKSLSQP